MALALWIYFGGVLGLNFFLYGLGVVASDWDGWLLNFRRLWITVWILVILL